MAKSYKQGKFVPTNPEKYDGKVDNICFRSSWELEFCKFCDRNVNILAWSSEEIVIPYVRPTDQSVRKYYPDYFIAYKNKNGDVIKELIEIKPADQTKPPRKNIKNPKQRMYEQVTYAVNIAKWTAATAWCKQRGITFRILTENQLFK